MILLESLTTFLHTLLFLFVCHSVPVANFCVEASAANADFFSVIVADTFAGAGYFGGTIPGLSHEGTLLKFLFFFGSWWRVCFFVPVLLGFFKNGNNFWFESAIPEGDAVINKICFCFFVMTKSYEVVFTNVSKYFCHNEHEVLFFGFGENGALGGEDHTIRIWHAKVVKVVVPAHKEVAYS